MNSPVAASAGPVLSARRDLIVRRQVFSGSPWWVVKDPLAMRYFRFADDGYFVLSQLDGRTDLAEIKRRFDARYAPNTISLEQLQHLVGSLHRSGLLLSDAAGQGGELLDRRRRLRRQEALSAVANLLAVRFRGFDPDRLLTALDRRIGWLFSWPAVAASLLLVLAAALLLATHFEEFQARLPGFHEYFTARNAIWLALVLAVTKVLHEFGHGLSCKRAGGECHEMGVMLLVFVPCLYCDVSDSWLLGDRWRRMAIAAAGMYVEMSLAAMATFLWWFSQPGLFQNLCLAVMLVCSVSTLLLNGNPLMRYDGYYILSDLLEQPNLRQRAVAVWQRWLSRWCLGIESPLDPFVTDSRPVSLAIYGLAAEIYRWLITFGILWFVHGALAPYRLQALGDLFATLSFMLLVGVPMWRLVRFVYHPGRVEQVKRKRVLATLTAVAAVVGLICLVPLPHRVWTTFELRSDGAAPVYIDVPGALIAVHARPGDVVQPGDSLVTLEDLELASEAVALTTQRNVRNAELDELTAFGQFADWRRQSQLPQVREALKSLADQSARRQAQLERLTVRAPAAGTVLAVPAIEPVLDDNGRLPGWSGSPFEESNLGCLLEQGTPLCMIGDPRRFVAHLVIDQHDVELVAEGQVVDLKFDSLPDATFTRRIDEIARRELETAPTQLSGKSGGDVATRTDAAGNERPQATVYQARVRLDDAGELLRGGWRGAARIHAPSRTLASRGWRWLNNTFRFRW